MEFNTSKFRVMILNRSCTNLSFSLNNDQLEIVKNYIYLGINITTRRLTTLYTDYFAQIKQKANQWLQCIKHFGFHNDGLRPGTALKLYTLLIRPILEYGAQVRIYDHYYLKSKFVKTASLDRQADFVKQLEKFQTTALKYLLGCPKSTSPKIQDSSIIFWNGTNI